MKCDADMKSNRSLMYSDFFIGELVGNWLIFVMVDLLTVMSKKGNEQTMCWTNTNQQIIEFQKSKTIFMTENRLNLHLKTLNYHFLKNQIQTNFLLSKSLMRSFVAQTSNDHLISTF